MHLNPKIIAVYVGMIAVLLVVVSFVLDYGSRTLAAPRDISGRYAIQLPENTDCVSGSTPVLVIGQSGSYLTADLLAGDAGEERLSRAYKGNGAMSGQIQADTIQLTGKAAYPDSCLANQTLRIEVAIDNERLQGQIVGSGGNIPISGQKSS